MRNKSLYMLLIVLCLLSLSTSLMAQVEKPFIGEWKFECPDAPEGFTTGTIEIKKDTVFTQYSSFRYKFPSTWVMISGDTLIYPTDVNGEIVTCRLKVESPDKLAGTAGTIYGTSLLLLTKKSVTWSESEN